MKMSIKILSFLLGLNLFVPLSSYAQVKPLIDFAIIDPDNPLVAFDTTAIIVHVKVSHCDVNADTSGFTANLLYHYQSDKMGGISSTWTETIDNDPVAEFMPPGGKFDTLYFYCDTAKFRTTGTNPVNVIIIWPSLLSPVVSLCDSDEYVLWEIPGYTGLEENMLDFGSTVFPNPASGTQVAYINSKYTQQIESITIYNAIGQVMNTKEFADGESSLGYVLPTDDLRAGIYHIHILYKDKKREVVKFIKN